MPRFRLNVVVVAIGLVLAGCPAVPPPVTPASAVTEVQADPLLLLAERTENGIEVRELDAGEMLAQAAAQADAGDLLGAAQAYEEIAGRFAGTTAEREALYRKGVCLEHADDWTGALVTFRRRLDLVGDGPLTADDLPALIHAALLAEQLELWAEAADGYTRLLTADALSAGDRRAATVRLAVVRLAQGDAETARTMLERVVADSDAARAAGEAVHPAPEAEAQVRLGDADADRLVEVRLDSPEPAEAQRQVRKLTQIFEAAFGHYRAALEVGSPYWAVESGYRIGALYMRIYDLFFDAPVPPGIDGARRDAYEALLRAQTRILIANADAAWNENLVRAERTGIRGEAVDGSAAGIARIEEILRVRQEHRSELDDAAEQYMSEHGMSDPLAPLLERLRDAGPETPESPTPEPQGAPTSAPPEGTSCGPEAPAP